MYDSTPNMPTPMKSPAVVARRKSRLVNRLIGITGSLTLSSTKTNATAAMMPAMMSPLICHDPHSKSWAPHAETSTMQEVTTELRAMPKTSIFGGGPGPSGRLGALRTLARAGSLTLSPRKTTATAALLPALMRPQISHDPHPTSWPPHAETRTMQEVTTEIRAMPKTSIFGRGPVPSARLGTLRKIAAAMRAMMPSGKLMAKAQRQPGPSVSQPPMSGPATDDTAKAEPMMPMYLPRSRAGTTEAMIDWERIIIPPPPMPWSTRPRMSVDISSAMSAKTDPARKQQIANMNSGLRPNRSPILP